MSIAFYSNTVSPPCRAVWLTLKTLGVDFSLNEVDFANNEHNSEKFLAINPRGKIPALQDGEVRLGESRAILQYLCNKYAKNELENLYPKDPDARAIVDQVLYIDESAIDAMYKYAKPFQVLFLGEKPGLGDEADIKVFFDLYEKFLSQRKFLAGDSMTIADISAICGFNVLELCKYCKYDAYPRLKQWMQTMKSVEFYEECVGKHAEAVMEMYQSKINA